MIWVLGIGLILVVCVYLIAPFLARTAPLSHSKEISAYRAELLALETLEEPAQSQKQRLQKRLITAAKTGTPVADVRSTALPVIICLGLLSGSLGIYAAIGSPHFKPEIRQTPPAEAVPTPDFQTLLPRFEERLAQNPEDVTGWYLYGRTLMLAGDNVAGLRAYERAMELSDDPAIRKEYEAAKTFANQVGNNPTADEVAAIQNLSEEDRQAAIEGMVENLRARLEESPNDPEAWIRLLRARKVLEQNDAARKDITALRDALPNQAEDIIEKTGW